MSNDIVQVIKKSDIQMLDKMVAEIQSGNYDLVKHKATLDILKIKKAYSKDGVNALRELNIKDGHDVDRERLALEREKFEFKKQQTLKKQSVDIEASSEDSSYLEDIYNVKIQIRQFNQQEYPNDLEKQKDMPTPKQLEADPKYAPLVPAIINYHGGFKRVAEILGLKYQN